MKVVVVATGRGNSRAAAITAMTDGLAGAGGRVLRTAFFALQIVRRPRPIHAEGLVLSGHIFWPGART